MAGPAPAMRISVFFPVSRENFSASGGKLLEPLVFRKIFAKRAGSFHTGTATLCGGTERLNAKAAKADLPLLSERVHACAASTATLSPHCAMRIRQFYGRSRGQWIAPPRGGSSPPGAVSRPMSGDERLPVRMTDCSRLSPGSSVRRDCGLPSGGRRGCGDTTQAQPRGGILSKCWRSPPACTQGWALLQ